MEMTDEMKALINAREADAREKGITEKIKYVTGVLGTSGNDGERNRVKSVSLGEMTVEHIDVTGPVRGYYNRYMVTFGGKAVYNDRVGKENSYSTGSNWTEPSYFEAYVPGNWEGNLDYLVGKALEIEDEKAINAARKELETKRSQDAFMKENFGA